jgi:hypothetical protein
LGSPRRFLRWTVLRRKFPVRWKKRTLFLIGEARHYPYH